MFDTDGNCYDCQLLGFFVFMKLSTITSLLFDINVDIFVLADKCQYN